jgi:hypothetical protein
MENVMIPEKRKSIDLLIEEFWRKGYLTLRRRFGTYLPEPQKLGEFDVDVVAKHRKSYAIGITISPDDLNDPELERKIVFLATRQTSFSSKRVLLFIGIDSERIAESREFIRKLSPAVSANIRLVPIVDRKSVVPVKREPVNLFS